MSKFARETGDFVLIRLLVVDDESATRNGIIRHLDWRQLGVGLVEEARDGLEGLEIARLLHPDIVISDIRMPGMNGVEFTTHIRDLYPECKIIFLSGYSDKEYLKAAIQLGAINYIEKPINIDELQETVKRAVELVQSEKHKAQKAGPVDNDNENVHVNNRAISSVIKYINENYSSPDLGVKTLAQHVFLTQTYLSSLFKRETGQTISEYITAYRIHQAVVMMAQPNVRLYEIAEKTGFGDANYFTRVFKQQRGLTPSEFMRIHLS